jgi:hypothetical protein
MSEYTGKLNIEKKTSSNNKAFYALSVNGQKCGTTFDEKMVGDFQNDDFVTVSTVKKGDFTNIGKIVFAQNAPRSTPIPLSPVAALAPSISSKPTQPYQSTETARNIQLQVSLKAAVDLVNGTFPNPEDTKQVKASLRTKEAAVKLVALSFFNFLQTGKVDVVEKEIVKTTITPEEINALPQESQDE